MQFSTNKYQIACIVIDDKKSMLESASTFMMTLKLLLKGFKVKDIHNAYFIDNMRHKRVQRGRKQP